MLMPPGPWRCTGTGADAALLPIWLQEVDRKDHRAKPCVQRHHRVYDLMLQAGGRIAVLLHRRHF
jgi:hypothetical protein